MTARYIASSSRSYAPYLDSAGLNFFEKKSSGCQAPSTNCLRAAPTAWSEASLKMASVAPGLG